MLTSRVSHPQTGQRAWKRWVAALVACATGATALGQASLPVDPGDTVHTFKAGNNLGDVVVTLVDTTPAGLTGAVLGQNHLAPIFWNQGAGVHEWTRANLGQVYGVTIDDAANPNIYVTAAYAGIIYPFSFPNEYTYGPGGGGGVYLLDGTTGNICLVTSLPNSATSGLGNITFGPTTRSLYVSNFEDGLIYRLPTGQCPLPQGVPFPTYDHGRNGRPAEALPPIGDDGQQGPTALGRRVWGLAVNTAENRLYYGVWWEDSTASNTTESNEIWSVSLDAAGDPIAAMATREFAVPDIQPDLSNPAAGLHFSNAGTLLVGERTVGTAHQSRLLEYTGATGAWVAQPVNKYRVGVGDTSCSGAAAHDCDNNVWSAGDGITLSNVALYGMMRIPFGGNATHVPSEGQSIVIDSDQDVNGQDKTQIGTLVHRVGGCVQPCAIVRGVGEPEPEIGADGTPTGCYFYNFTITNQSGVPVQYMLIPDTNVTPNVIFFNPALAPNATSGVLQVKICNQPAGTYTFPIVLMDINNDECCTLDHDVEIPDCFRLDARVVARCTTQGCNLSITIQPLDFNVGHIFVTPLSPTGATIPSQYFPIAIPQFGSQKINVPFSGVGVGQQLCVRVFIHTPDLAECCDREICVTVEGDCPDCPVPGTCDTIDFNNDGLFPDDQDLIDFLAVLAGGTCSNDPFCGDIDFNNDGLFPSDADMISFLSVLAGGDC